MKNILTFCTAYSSYGSLLPIRGIFFAILRKNAGGSSAVMLLFSRITRTATINIAAKETKRINLFDLTPVDNFVVNNGD